MQSSIKVNKKDEIQIQYTTKKEFYPEEKEAYLTNVESKIDLWCCGDFCQLNTSQSHLRKLIHVIVCIQVCGTLIIIIND